MQTVGSNFQAVFLHTMDFDNILGLFFDSALTKWKPSPMELAEADFIFVLTEETSGDCFRFHLSKLKSEFYWERTQWNRLRDNNEVKMKASVLFPSSSTQWGTTNLSEAAEIFRNAEESIISSHALSPIDIIEIKTNYIIQTRIGQVTREYKWTSIPENFSVLGSLLEMLFDLNRKVA